MLLFSYSIHISEEKWSIFSPLLACDFRLPVSLRTWNRQVEKQGQLQLVYNKERIPYCIVQHLQVEQNENCLLVKSGESHAYHDRVQKREEQSCGASPPK